ncbi:unnamed protein product [Arctogadus glacialis]
MDDEGVVGLYSNGRTSLAEQVVLPGAARAVSEVSCRIQDNARSHQNHLQLLRVQRLLKGRRTKVLAPEPIVSPCVDSELMISVSPCLSSQLSFPKAKLLLMSCDQEDINDWHQSLASAVGKLQSKNKTVHQRDELCRRPLRPAPDPPQNAGPPPPRRRPPREEEEQGELVPEPSASNCVIL